MATTAMLLMAARRWAITDRAISTTASSWAWDRGPIGATVTAGASIVSAAVVEGPIAAEANARPIVDTKAAEPGPAHLVPHHTQRPRMPHLTQRPHMAQRPAPSRRVAALLTPQRLIARLLTAEAKAIITSNRELKNPAAFG